MYFEEIRAIARVLAGEQKELVGGEGLDWEPGKVEDGQGGHAGACLGFAPVAAVQAEGSEGLAGLQR